MGDLLSQLLIDCEEDRTLRAVLVGMLLEAERSGPSWQLSLKPYRTGERAPHGEPDYGRKRERERPWVVGSPVSS